MRTIIVTNSRSIVTDEGQIKYLLKRKAPKGYWKAHEYFDAYFYDVSNKNIVSRALVYIEKIDLDYIHWAYQQAPSGSQLPITERVASHLLKQAGLKDIKVAYLYNVLRVEVFKRPIKLSQITSHRMTGEFIYA